MSEFDQAFTVCENALMAAFGDEADIWPGSADPDRDDPVATDIRVDYHSSYMQYDPEGYPHYKQALTLPKDLGNGVKPASDMWVLVGNARYQLVQQLDVEGPYQVWSVIT